MIQLEDIVKITKNLKNVNITSDNILIDNLKSKYCGKIGIIFDAKIDKSITDEIIYYVSVEGLIIYCLASELELIS